MKKLTARIRAIISSPKKDLRKVEPQLISLEKEMEEIKKMPNKVEAIVRLFQVISPIQDKNNFSYLIKKLNKRNYGQLDEVVKAFGGILVQLEKAGRDSDGMNRTKKGEAVTSSNVFLGDVYGIWTKPASYWLQDQEKFKNEDSGVSPKPGCDREFISVWYCINDYQARNFVESHTSGMLEKISIIRNAF